ncbi:MAG: T9SS type A sorting domain-containing protein [Bacteroidetes bacterium]|nr:T9SS type A sorting domain-containing protein [Bacteroidota bacterium]
MKDIDLGPDGINPDNVMVDGSNVYTLNNKNWNGSSVSGYSNATGMVTTTNLPVVLGCGTSVFADGNVYYQESFDNRLVRFQVSSKKTIDTLNINRNLYGMGVDVLNSKLYCSETDYTSFGMVVVYSYTGVVQDVFLTGVSPGNFAFDIRTPSDVNDLANASLKINIYPTIVQNKLTINITQKVESSIQLSIYNILGQLKYQRSYNHPGQNLDLTISTENWTRGIYLVKVKSSEGNLTGKVIKE